ncbi:transposase [Prosthecobacter algae]|uniref:transposase n=1 Tax=Prosthecobacter algae TaxID=1144682 RepID=UPI0031EC5B7B
MAFQFFNPASRLSVSHGNLPHWGQEGATYFITWRMADSVPSTIWKRWCVERDDWLVRHNIDIQSSTWRTQIEDLPETSRRDFKRFTRSIEKELDAGHGSCLLRQQEMAKIVAEALHFFDTSRYILGDFVIMPNHVHVLVGGMGRDTMLKQVESWKRWTAAQINKSLGRTGRFWQVESFDHLVRSELSFQKLRQYIAANPGSARLKPGEYLLWQREPASPNEAQK